MQTTIDNRKKVLVKFPRSVLKRMNKTKESGTLGLGVNKEQESTKVRAK